MDGMHWNPDPSPSWRSRAVTFLGLDRNIVAFSMSMLLPSLGENLCRKFLPRYPQALGGPTPAIAMGVRMSPGVAPCCSGLWALA